MANDFSGYFLQGLGEGFQTGFQLSQQRREMKWKEAQQKKLEQKQKEIEDAAQNYTNMVGEYSLDNVLTNDEISKLNTAFLASGYEVQALIKDTHNAIQGKKTKKVQEDFEMLDMWVNWTKGQSPENIEGSFKEIQGWVHTEEGKRRLDAYNNLVKRQTAETEKELFSPLEVAGKIPENYRVPYLEREGVIEPGLEPTKTVEKPKELGMPDYNTAVNYLKHFVTARNKKAFESEKARMEKEFGYDLGNITYESLVEPEKSTGDRATSLTTLNQYQENVINSSTWEEAQSQIKEYEKAGYDPSQINIDQEQWAMDKMNTLKEIMDNVYAQNWNPNEIVNPEDVGGLISEPVKKAELYDALYDAYMKYLKELEKLGLDTSNYPKLKSLSEMEKVGYLEGAVTGGGVARGQYKSIYK